MSASRVVAGQWSRRLEAFGPVASVPTVSRHIGPLAAAGPKALHAIRAARFEVRARVWRLAGTSAPDAAGEGPWTAELDGDVLKGRPRGMLLVVRKERPPPGAPSER